MEEETKRCLEMEREIGRKRFCEVQERDREREEGAVFRRDNPFVTFKYHLLIKVKWISCFS